MLHLALEVDRRLQRGDPIRSVLEHLRGSPARFDRRMLDALANYTPAPAEFELRSLPLRELQAGMVLEIDILSNNGAVLILKKGTALTEVWIERIRNFAQSWGIARVIPVRIGSLTGGNPPRSEEFQ